MMDQLCRRTENRSVAKDSLALYRPEDAPELEERMAVVEDIGPGGLFVAGSQPPPVGTILSLLIYSQSGAAGNAAVRCRAVVRWHRLDQPPCGMGVEILDAAGPQDGQRLGSWLASWPKTAAALPAFD
jgi:hypothetical protein